MKTCKQLSEEIFEGIEKRNEQNKRRARRVKRGVLACVILLLLPLSVALATRHDSITPLFQPIEKVWEQSGEDSSSFVSHQAA